jgi:hypothetical protein
MHVLEHAHNFIPKSSSYHLILLYPSPPHAHVSWSLLSPGVTYIPPLPIHPLPLLTPSGSFSSLPPPLIPTSPFLIYLPLSHPYPSSLPLCSLSLPIHSSPPTPHLHPPLSHHFPPSPLPNPCIRENFLQKWVF